MMSPVVECEAFRIEENVVTEELWLVTGDCMVRLPGSVITAIRGLSAKQVPHLRKARKEVFSERSRKGWVTRRSDREDRLVLEEAAEPVADKNDEFTTFDCPVGVFAEGVAADV
jgi:hypothetical protein